MLQIYISSPWMDIQFDLQKFSFWGWLQETKEVKDSTDAARKVPGLSLMQRHFETPTDDGLIDGWVPRNQFFERIHSTS